MISKFPISGGAVSDNIAIDGSDLVSQGVLTKWKQTFSRDGCAYKGGVVYVYLAGTTTAARVFDENKTLVDTAPQLVTDGVGYVEFYIDTKDYPTGQLFDITCTSGECYSQDSIELKSLQILQDTEGGRNYKQIFAQDGPPDFDDNNVKESDLWFETDDNNEPHVAQYVDSVLSWVSRRDGSIAAAAGTANWSEVTDDDGNRPEDGSDVTQDHMHYITVSPRAGEAMYSNLSTAWAALSANWAGVYLKNGTYQPASTLTLPDFDVDIVGESRGGVVVETVAAGNTFERTTTVANTYSFKNLTFDSQTASTGYHVIHMEEGAFDLQVENCKFDLWDDGVAGSSGVGDSAVYIANNSLAAIAIKNSIVNNGKYGFFALDVVDYACNNNVLDGQKVEAIGSRNHNAIIQKNTLKNFAAYAIGATGVSFSGGIVNCSHNILQGPTTAPIDRLTCIDVDGANYASIAVDNNTININNSLTGSYGVYGIDVSNPNQAVSISNNSITIITGINQAVVGIAMLGGENGVFASNSILINAPTSSARLGINVGAGTNPDDKHNISNNTIDLVNNTAADTGIYLGSNTTNCYGDGNITANCGTDLDDNDLTLSNNIGFQAA